PSIALPLWNGWRLVWLNGCDPEAAAGASRRRSRCCSGGLKVLYSVSCYVHNRSGKKAQEEHAGDANVNGSAYWNGHRDRRQVSGVLRPVNRPDDSEVIVK